MKVTFEQRHLKKTQLRILLEKVDILHSEDILEVRTLFEGEDIYWKVNVDAFFLQCISDLTLKKGKININCIHNTVSRASSFFCFPIYIKTDDM